MAPTIIDFSNKSKIQKSKENTNLIVSSGKSISDTSTSIFSHSENSDEVLSKVSNGVFDQVPSDIFSENPNAVLERYSDKNNVQNAKNNDDVVDNNFPDSLLDIELLKPNFENINPPKHRSNSPDSNFPDSNQRQKYSKVVGFDFDDLPKNSKVDVAAYLNESQNPLTKTKDEVNSKNDPQPAHQKYQVNTPPSSKELDPNNQNKDFAIPVVDSDKRTNLQKKIDFFVPIFWNAFCFVLGCLFVVLINNK